MTIIDGVAYMGGGAARLFYDNPLAGDYQDYVGNNYHAAEFLTAVVPMADLQDASKTEVTDSSISWGRISGWLPWMKMRSRDVFLYSIQAVCVLNHMRTCLIWSKMKLKKIIRSTKPPHPWMMIGQMKQPGLCLNPMLTKNEPILSKCCKSILWT